MVSTEDEQPGWCRVNPKAFSFPLCWEPVIHPLSLWDAVTFKQLNHWREGLPALTAGGQPGPSPRDLPPSASFYGFLVTNTFITLTPLGKSWVLLHFQVALMGCTEGRKGQESVGTAPTSPSSSSQLLHPPLAHTASALSPSPIHQQWLWFPFIPV